MTKNDSPQWARFEKLCARRTRAWNHYCEARRILTAAAHPETAGHAGLVHNWGNDEARAIESRLAARWRRYSDKMDSAVGEALREYIAAPVATVRVYRSSVRQIGAPDINGARSIIIGERDTLIHAGSPASAAAALRAVPIGESVAVRHPGGLRSCMNKPALWDWTAAL